MGRKEPPSRDTSPQWCFAGLQMISVQILPRGLFAPVASISIILISSFGWPHIFLISCFALSMPRDLEHLLHRTLWTTTPINPQLSTAHLLAPWVWRAVGFIVVRGGHSLCR